MQRVILIGASGYLGSQLLKELQRREFEIFAVQNKTALLPSPRITIIEGGIRALTPKKLQEIHPDFILHAGRPTMPQFKKWGRKYAANKAMKLNRALLKNIELSSLQCPLVFASGSLTYGNSDIAHQEDAVINPISYARDYFKGEMPFHKAIESSSFPILILKFPWLLGEGSWFEWFYTKQIQESNVIPMFGDGSNLMSILHVKDAAQIMLKYGQASLRSGIFNIYSPDVISQFEFAQKVKEISGCEIKSFDLLFSKTLEPAVEEAFCSNIVMQTRFQDVLKNHSFSNLDACLSALLKEARYLTK